MADSFYFATPQHVVEMLARGFLPFCREHKHDTLHHQRHYQERIKTMAT